MSSSVSGYGGACAQTDAEQATGANVVIVDNTPNAWVYGGYVVDNASTEASNNTITVQPGATVGAVFGGRALSGLSGAVANNNQVFIYGGAVGSVYGGQSNVRAQGNRVVVTGGELSEVAGAQGAGGVISDNTVTVDGSNVTISGLVYGARINGTGEASNNSVAVSDATIGNAVFGAYVQRGSASGNTVRISGATSVKTNIYGGYSGSAGDALNNRVVIEDAPDIGQVLVFGGYAGDGASSGNVLEVHSSGLAAGNIFDFQELHFVLPAEITAGSTVLSLSGKQVASRDNRNPPPGPTDLRGVKVGVTIKAGGNVLQDGDRVTLVNNDYGVLTDPEIAQADVTGYQGVSLEYTFGLSADPNNLYATTRFESGSDNTPTVLDQTKAPLEGQASAMAMTVQGGDLAAGAGVARAMAATSGVSGVSTFGVSGGGSSRYKSGSHVDVNGVSVMTGVARRFERQSGQVLAGAFVEGGWGHYDTYNDFSTGDVRGSGRSRYFGGGVLLRQDWAGNTTGQPYVEGTLRVGRVSSDWGSDDMVGSTSASYDTSALYYGAHFGFGYVLSLNEQTAIDFFAKYFWTHQKGDSVTVAGDPYEFQAVDSHRTRVGLRLTRQFTDQVAAYAGAAWEREYDGQARATVYGLDTPSPSLKGNTGVFELGFDLTPDPKSPLMVGLGVQAYTGKRQGVSGTAKVMWVF